MIDIKVPSPGESITQVILANWLVKDGDYVEKDDEIAEIDSDKATLSISAEESGVIKIMVDEGDTIDVGAIVAQIDSTATAPEESKEEVEESQEEAAPVAEKKAELEATVPAEVNEDIESSHPQIHLSPLAKKMMAAKGLSLQEVLDRYGSLRLTREDIEKLPQVINATAASAVENSPQTEDKREKMSPLRKKLAQRLVSVKNETAMLTTFNEVNMSPIMKVRKQYGKAFLEKYGVKLGFMGFFTKAVVEALKQYPQIKSQIDGDDILTPANSDVGIAVSAPKGLVVPVVRDAAQLSLAEIEQEIHRLADKARNNRISLDDMTGGSFTITNGGVFGSMLSTPIINPPQSAILGMHNIQERPIAVDGKVEIHPMMYVALSYDHRLIDGKESVSFLKSVKEMLENPEQLFFGQDPVKKLLDL